MSESEPATSRIDHVASYVRLRDGQVELEIVEPTVAIARRHPQLTLRRGRQRVNIRGDFVKNEAVRKVTATVPRGDLTDGVWRIILRPGGNRPTRLDARLLVQGERPLVLLWGAEAEPSRVPAPRAAHLSLARRVGSRVRRSLRPR
jgi:hypothetical protein